MESCWVLSMLFLEFFYDSLGYIFNSFFNNLSEKLGFLCSFFVGGLFNIRKELCSIGF